MGVSENTMVIWDITHRIQDCGSGPEKDLIGLVRDEAYSLLKPRARES